MSTLSKYQQSRASSKTTKKNITILRSGITLRKIQKSHPTPRWGNSCQKRTAPAVSAKSAETVRQSKTLSAVSVICWNPRTPRDVPPRKNSHYTEARQMIYNANQLTGSRKRRAPTERHFRTDGVLLWGLWMSSHW